ncbi:hypothetical protein DY245_18660 [Streptomyces inhibens]|uniref:Uncharacterized protein n=1 Tax=Streptomyces inhibens TaxID=2293571 RepID=A0A371Q2C8_STRIH|nr:hypothetical protein DY245_18660 [Streptomyces inhibens]
MLREAFAALEEAAAAGHLSTYGIATWSGFTEGLVTVEELDRLASEDAGGSPDHQLRPVQLAVSLVEAGALKQALDGRGAISEANEREWQVFASAPLHGGELVGAAAAPTSTAKTTPPDRQGVHQPNASWAPAGRHAPPRLRRGARKESRLRQ